jgi:predicted nucleotidyltransferase
MKSCGIIVEYNPFHNGHKIHIDNAKKESKCDVLIAVMSGNYVQRGEPAIIDKFTRASFAINNGVDLVLELPYIFSTQSASKFAYGAVSILKLAKVDSICFGSESNNLDELIEIAKSPINTDNLKESLNKGNSFVRSYGLLSRTMAPNDILGVSYLKEMLKTNIKPISIQRTNHYHDLEIKDVSSASAIRNALFNNTDIKDTTNMKEILLNNELINLEMFYPHIRLLLLTLDKDYLSNIFLFSEGIENHLIKQAHKYSDFNDFINASTTRRYTTSRIKRTLIQLLNQVTKKEVDNLKPINTIRILALNNKGRKYINTLKDVNIASRFSKVQDGYRELEKKAALSYSSVLSEKNRQDLIAKEIGGSIYIDI